MSVRSPFVTERIPIAAIPVVGDDVRIAYRRHRSALVTQRLPATTLVYLMGVGAATLAECWLFPERLELALPVYLGHVVVSMIGLIVAMLRVRWLSPTTVAAIMASGWSVLLTFYTAAVGAPERGASGQLCLLFGLFFMLPWAWRQQILVSAVAVAGVVGVANLHGVDEPTIYAFIVTMTGAVTSVGGVVFLDRYRFEGFARQTALKRASREKEEEAEIAAALLRVAEQLTANAAAPDLLESLTRVAVEAVGCDWGSTFEYDEARRRYRTISVWGASDPVRDEMLAVEFGPGDLAIIDRVAPGGLIEIADRDAQDLVPVPLLERWAVASELVAPITLGDRVIGVLCLAYRKRRGAFTERERRLARGIVHTTAIALETSRLVTDLRAANRLRSEFVSTMSHELRTPLNVILGYAEMARDPGLDPADRRILLRRVSTAGSDLLQLIEDTLALGRMEAGRDDVMLERIALDEVWTTIGEECRGLQRKAQVELHWDDAPSDVSIVTDRRKLTLVLRNLVHNALKFTEDGSVVAQARVDDESLVITVRDTGIGIDASAHEAIFEMFRQGDGSDTRRYGGTGLGLHIVRRSVQQLGGTVRVESAPGRGATFTVELPRTARSTRAA